MNRLGRVNLLVLAAIAVLALFAVLFFFSQDSMTGAGTKFMTALAKGDVKTLSDLTYRGGRDPAKIEEDWKFATDVAKHYRFVWVIDGSQEADANSGAIQMRVWRNIDSPAAYDEKFQLPMVKEDGRWRVQVNAISREMYPGLPR